MSQKQINLIIVERDDSMFDLLKQDIKQYSPYVSRVYRCSYHEDVYSVKSWYNCKLIIANNPENAGFNFFKSLYRKQDKIYQNKVHGLIYTSGQEDELRFYRAAISLYEWSRHLFLGVVYKRFGGLEKILEIIRNICCEFPLYPVIDWLQKESDAFILDSIQLQTLRKTHNLKYEILTKLQPLISLLRRYTETDNPQLIRDIIVNFNNLFENSYTHTQQLMEKFLQIKFKDKSLDSSLDARMETSFYVKQIKKFFAPEMKSENNLYGFLQLFSDDKKLVRGTIDDIKPSIRDSHIEVFLREYSKFIYSLNKLINLVDEECVIGR